MSLTGKNNEEKIWNFLTGKGLNSYGAAGLMGNLFAESGLNPHNLQNTYEKKLGYTDNSYTEAVDSGKYTGFTHDSAGYGLAQWTYWSRKEALRIMSRLPVPRLEIWRLSSASSGKSSAKTTPQCWPR